VYQSAIQGKYSCHGMAELVHVHPIRSSEVEDPGVIVGHELHDTFRQMLDVDRSAVSTSITFVGLAVLQAVNYGGR
jgi:hypothetical protein